MKSVLTAVLLFFLVVTNMNGQKVFPYETHYVELPNGFKSILIPMDSPGLVSYYSVVRTGSRDEWEPGKSGFAHFFEHMMFRGTDRYPGRVYDSIITSIGADANAYTDDDLTVYHLNFASEDLEKVMDLESDRFQYLNYSKEQFQTESGAVYGEYRKGRTSPVSVAFEKLREIAFTEHTYGHTTIGYEADIKDMPNQFEYSKSFYKRYYRPENVILVIAGDLDVAKTTGMIKKYYSSWKPGYVMPEIKPEPEQKEFRKAEVEYDGKTLPLILIGFKADAFNVNDKDYMASFAFAELAFGETSELYKKLVLEEQKVQFVAGWPAMQRDPYLFTIYSMIKNPDDIDYVLSEIDKTIEKFSRELPDAGKLANLIKSSKYSFLMNLDTPENVASSLPPYITLTGDIKVIDQFYNALSKITPEDIKNAVGKYFVKEKKNLVVLRGK
ncbi:MAG: insulinase family protein [Ignavibacteriaceae bacterium]|nr:insulinase family protein [Ignavibacteriaceae bacterium]